MNRSRLLSLALILTLLAVLACARVSPLFPATPGSPTINFIATIVAQTLTAFPFPTLQPSFTPTLTQTPTLPAQTPGQFISYYFGAINSRNYPLAWSLLTDRFKNTLAATSQDAYHTYLDFWNTVKRVNVIDVNNICRGDVCAVDVTLQLYYVNGQIETNTYAYTLTYDHGRNTWMFDSIPTPTATLTKFHPATATFTRTPTPTPSMTPTKTRTPTRTPSATKTKTRTPTRTRSTTATKTKTPTASRTRTRTASPALNTSYTPGLFPPPTSTFTPTWTP